MCCQGSFGSFSARHARINIIILGCVRLTLILKRKFFRIFLQNLEHRKVNKTRFLV